MRLVCIESLAEFADLKKVWDELVGKLNPLPLPLTHTWLTVWWQVFGNRHRMHFKCLFDGDKLVGSAPFTLSHAWSRGIPVTVQKLAVNGHSPFSTIVIDPDLSAGERDNAYRLLTQVQGSDIVSLAKIDVKSELSAFLAGRSGDIGTRTGSRENLRTPLIRINGGWDEFYASRPRKLRKSLNNKINRYTKHDDFTIVHEPIMSSDSSALQEMVAVSARSWKRTIGRDLVTCKPSKTFLFGLADALGQEALVSLWIMRKGGIPIAYELHIACDGVIYPVRADYDDDYKQYSPGSILEYTILKYLFETRCATHYFTCADDYWYLSNWTQEHVNHVDIELFSNSFKGQLLFFLEYRLIPRLRKARSNDAVARRQPFWKTAK